MKILAATGNIYRSLKIEPDDGVENDEICIKNDEFCIKNDEFCTKHDEICINTGYLIGSNADAFHSTGELIKNDEFVY